MTMFVYTYKRNKNVFSLRRNFFAYRNKIITQFYHNIKDPIPKINMHND